jgi:hypothetical protein
MNDYYINILIILFSGTIVYFLGVRLKLQSLLSVSLFIWHTAFCLIYFVWAENQDADANNYYLEALNGASDWSPGTRFIEALTGFFIVSLGASKLNTYLIYNIPGILGLLLLASALLHVLPSTRNKLVSIYAPYIILFSPNLSFWSCAIGKDGIAFLAACMAAFSSLDISRRKIQAFLSVFLMFLVRPHIAIIIITSFGILFSLKKTIGISYRILLLILISIPASMIISYSLDYGGVDNSSVGGVTTFIESRQSSNLEGGSSIEISNLPLPMQMMTYLFRPLFFDSLGNILSIFVSCENLILLLWSIRNTPKLIRSKNEENSIVFAFNVIYTLLTLVLLSITTANLGIAVRQKTMFMPSYFLLMAIAIRNEFDKKNSTHSPKSQK